MNEYIPVNQPLLGDNEKKLLIQCVDSGWISSEGPFIKEFEDKFATRMGRKHAISVSNGTCAIDAVIDALEIGHGDEVIIPTFTIISCIAQIVRNGGVPVLIDSDPETWNLDVKKVESKITSRTKAIMVVHIYGLPVDMDPIIELAKKYRLKIIEDAAEMHGQTYRGKMCGSFGDVSTFSFYPNKHITTGEGGMILTDDDTIAASCRSLRNLCFEPPKRFVHHRLGWNLRMTSMQAALGIAQLERLDSIVEKKRQIGSEYARRLQGIPGITLPLPETNYAKNIYWVFGIEVHESTGFDAEFVMAKMATYGVGTRPFFYPMHLQPVFKKMGLFNGETYPVAERISRQGFYIPSGLGLTELQIERVVDAVQKVFT